MFANRRISTGLKFVLAGILLFSMMIGFAPAKVSAYGNTAIWQIGLSGNCTSPTLCADGQGGFWGWIEFDQGGTGDATIAECGHMVNSGPLHLAGANYFSIEITNWTVMYGTFVITGGEITYKGNNAPPPETITSANPFFTGIPAQAGHYNTTDILGFSAPGVNFQFQVAQIPNR